MQEEIQNALSDDELKLIEYLRKDASEVKECFTRFSFQVITVSTLALGLIAKFQLDAPLIGLGSICIILLALSVGRIGTYKYGTANRAAGYELHLERVRQLRETRSWKHAYRKIGWEEAVRAWRTVQPTIFRYYYYWGTNRSNSLRKEHAALKYSWFLPKALHEEGTVYFAGSYLRTMFSILYMIVGLGLLSMVAMVTQFLLDDAWQMAVIGAMLTAAIFVVALVKVRQLSQRRRLLEGEILCIHSCAIMWQLVVVAHFRALATLEGYDGTQLDSFQGYTRALSKQASLLKQHLTDGGSPHTWVSTSSGSKDAEEAKLEPAISPGRLHEPAASLHIVSITKDRPFPEQPN
jgi:hypothetical protein